MIKQYDRITLAFGAADTTKSATITGIRGPSGEATIKRTMMAVVAIPDWTNAVTLTYSHILDTTAPCYSIAALAKNQVITAPVVILYVRPILDRCVITGTLSGAPGGTGGNVTIDLYIED